MVQFPETVQLELERITEAANAELNIRKKIKHDLEVERETEQVRIRYEAKALHQQELDTESTPKLEMMTLATYQSNPQAVPVDLIEGVVKDDGLCVVIGPSGAGKSTLTLQMWYSLATGADFLGQDAMQLSGGIGIVSYDQAAALTMDWMAGFPSIDPAKVSIVDAYKRGNPLGVPAMRQQIAAAWKAIGVEIVVIDSFSASFFGENQNDAAHVMSHYRDLKLFALTEVGARSVIVIAHAKPSDPNSARGSSVHHDVADSIMSVAKDDKTGIRTVDMTKYRAARGQVQMKPVMVTAPDVVTHLVDLDPGAMTLAGMALPASAGTTMFPDTPAGVNDPDVTSDSEEEDDDL